MGDVVYGIDFHKGRYVRAAKDDTTTPDPNYCVVYYWAANPDDPDPVVHIQIIDTDLPTPA